MHGVVLRHSYTKAAAIAKRLFRIGEQGMLQAVSHMSCCGLLGNSTCQHDVMKEQLIH